MIYNPQELFIVRESYEFWRGKSAPRMQAVAVTACEGGETGFIWKKDSEGKLYTPTGDHGEANGIFQWHAARAAKIKAETGFDVIHGTHLDMLNGAYAEMTAPWSAYRHVWPALMAAKTAWSAMQELVAKEEQSASQASDIVKRSAIALYIDHVVTTEGWTA